MISRRRFLQVSAAASAGLLGGLFNNFEKMDRAHIVSAIPIQNTIPVQFDLQLNQQTNGSAHAAQVRESAS